MDNKDIKRYSFIALLAVAGCLIVLNFGHILHFAGIALSALTPLIIGCALAYVFNIIMNFFEKHYFPKSDSKVIHATRRPACLIFSFAITIAIILLVMNIIIPEIVNAFKLIYAEIPPTFMKAKDKLLDKLDEYPDVRKELENIEVDKSAMIEKISNGAFGIFGSIIAFIGAVTSAVMNTVIGIIFAIYLLLRKDKLYTDVRRFMNAHVSEEKNAKINHICFVAHDTFTHFFIGQFIEALLLGTLTAIGSHLLNLPYSMMTGTIIGVTALIPIVGALCGAALSAFIIFTVSPTKALIFLVFLIILQQVDDNVIYPKIMGTSVGLPGIWVLAAVTVGGGLFGIIGMVLGVPLAATCYKLYFEKLDAIEAASGTAPPSVPESTKKQQPQKTDPAASKHRKKHGTEKNSPK